MKLITKDVDYAVRALSYIGKNQPRSVTISELTKKLDISRLFLRKILQNLAKAGILSSSKGKYGGFILKQSPGKILLGKLIKILHGEINIIDCRVKEKLCPNRKFCLLRRKVKGIEANIKRQLQNISLDSLLK